MTDYPHRGPVDAAIHGLRRLYGKYTNGQEPSLKVSVGKKLWGKPIFTLEVRGESALTVALTADQTKELVMRLSDRSVRIMHGIQPSLVDDEIAVLNKTIVLICDVVRQVKAGEPYGSRSHEITAALSLVAIIVRSHRLGNPLALQLGFGKNWAGEPRISLQATNDEQPVSLTHDETRHLVGLLSERSLKIMHVMEDPTFKEEGVVLSKIVVQICQHVDSSKEWGAS